MASNSNARSWKNWLLPIGAAILFLVLWQLATLIFHIPKWMLPSPVEIATEAYDSFPRLWGHTVETVRTTIVGFAAGVTVGIMLAVLLHFFPLVKITLYPFLIISQNVPIIALAPLLMLWFGFGLLPKMIMIIIVCFFPITLSTLNGFAQTDTTLYNYMLMSGANKKQLFWKLELPHAVPFLFSGLKISAVYSVMAAFIAEWLGSNIGIGAYMIIAKSAFRADRVFIGIVIIVCLSMVVYGLIVLLEKRLTRWRGKV
ncbi:ABC transporter permease [Paenibacillus yanchengensis]|uniref:ABC transporter permease n=1 Tax=Paenibacillus yanchengensis TaxID=2035833 RepID=A0ABW4YHN3_9BACL